MQTILFALFAILTLFQGRLNNIYLTDLNYSKEELADNLGLKLHEFSNIYFDRQTLRLASRK
ncbi:hypothetical protein LEP1GSC074_1593 [Leptospira noguchii str. Hook]|nr:hypothetical protein LEP1GSC041_0521 [Leptospira noguchii str. 2006001870]EMS89785.1 hypothetical protein LEP1GSC074_1593 [Leptospira noguchii str. Hook]